MLLGWIFLGFDYVFSGLGWWFGLVFEFVLLICYELLVCTVGLFLSLGRSFS